MRRTLLPFFLAIATFVGAVGGPVMRSEAVPRAAIGRPNILSVLTDDAAPQDFAAVIAMRPNGGFAWVAHHGVTFDRSYTAGNLCCPGRAALWTGQTPYNNGVKVNGYHVLHGTLPDWAQAAGYYTGFVGKWYNGTTKPKVQKTPATGWDDWEPLIGDKGPEFGYQIRTQAGDIIKSNVFQTDYISQRTTAMVDAAQSAGEPFFVNMWTYAPHEDANPAPQYANTPVPPPDKTPSTLESDTSDKPAWLTSRLPGPSWKSAITSYTRRVRTLLSVDDAIAAQVQHLTDLGEIDNTYITVSADNGFIELREHNLPSDKNVAYRAAQLPLIVAGPDIPQDVASSAFASNLDMAPMFTSIMGATATRSPDGRDLRDVLATGGDDRFVPTYIPSGAWNPSGDAVRTAGWFYAVYSNGEHELYDEHNDPNELDNRAGDPNYAAVETQMAALLKVAKTCAGVTCSTSAPAALQ